MKKTALNIALAFVAFAMMSNTGCNGIMPVIDSEDLPNRCVDAVGAYTPSATYLGEIKGKISDTVQYNNILATVADGEKYWVLGAIQLMVLPSTHPLYGCADRVITYNAATHSFVRDAIICCGYYNIPADNTATADASVFYDCDSNYGYSTNFSHN